MKRRWFFASGLVLILLGALGFVRLGVFLSAAGQVPETSDLIVVLGGDSGPRSLTGARLYREGMAPKVLLTGLEQGAAEALPYYLHWRSQLLQAYGVDEPSILFDSISTNSWLEAQNTLKLLASNDWDRVIVVSDPPHMRRLNWIWSKVFQGSGRYYLLVPSEPVWWDANRWWANEMSAKFVANEFIKLIYYRIKYAF